MERIMKIQALLYNAAESMEYLLLRRPESRGGMWGPVTGHVEKGEKLLDALQREIEEETGIGELAYIIDLRVPFEFTKDNTKIEEHSFGVQTGTREVRISEEHVEYAWLPYKQAAERLNWPNQKTSLQVLNDMINL
ncbi:MAG: NUDIX domain-containing protein [Candidatus Thermoplasmatota archaeon]|nr:NUDIX domain-containing protein [Candidatus Sysuiplasma jiujiangense]MBX8639891.1 NUDIX domain-containing protein [Candidatus Sysuiplasma jiujiangense]MBX8642273.1 NUDIX domain-containing protein [Candidatus Sysuiplasma jiujiangense]MCL4317798.1 NUDIX domain-containing protein [Candidatus Thermoplasmatota archaeon]MCL5254151.1 NUDIX domain-containing protein [Candidatus Thermoplasmatota archaeon]